MCGLMRTWAVSLALVLVPAGAWGQEKAKAAVFTPHFLGDVMVRLVKVEYGFVSLEGVARKSDQSRTRQLVAHIEVRNYNKTRLARLRGWGGAQVSGQARLADNFSNEYQRTEFDLAERVRGQLRGTVDIDPDTGVSDVLVFRKPVKGFTTLQLDLPTANLVGAPKEVRVLRWTIPRAAIVDVAKLLD